MIASSPAEHRPSLFSRIAHGGPLSPADIASSREARVLSRGHLNAYTIAAHWDDEADGDWAPSDGSDQALLLSAIAAFADGRITSDAAQHEILEAAARGSLGTGAARRRSLAWADKSLADVAAAMHLIRSPSGRAGRDVIAQHFRPLVPPPNGYYQATTAQLQARRARVRSVARWALSVAAGDDPVAAAHKAISDAA